MKKVFGFQLIDPGTYRLSIASSEGEAPFEVLVFDIVFDHQTSLPYLNQLLEHGGYIEKTWAERMLADLHAASP